MKLLVDAPSGMQEVIDVGHGGGYFDASRVLWDERVDGSLPEITLGGMVRVNDGLVFDHGRMDEHIAATIGPLKATLIAKVDDHIASIYSKWMRFEAEYIERETAAQTFIDGGYIGDPGIWVTSFAAGTGVTNTEAAYLIVSQAAGLRSALQALGALRMSKYSINATADVETAQSLHDSIIAAANVIAAAL